MKVKGVTFSEVKAKALADPAVRAAWEEEHREEEMQAMLNAMRLKAGLTQSEVAKRMGISSPAVSQLEHNVMNASLEMLERYAAACGVQIKLSFR